MQMMSVNNVRLHYCDSGDAELPTLVFSNSLGTDFRIWDRVCALISDRARIIRYDKRGHGLSTAPPAPYKMADHVNDLEALLDNLSVSNAIVVGLSVGGVIAQGLSSRRPDLTRALVLCDTASRIGSVELWDQRIDAITDLGLDPIADGVMERWFPSGFRSTHSVELSGWRAMLTRTPVNGYLGTCAALRDTDFTQQTSKLELPVLCLCGSGDLATPPDLVKATAALIEGARYAEIANAGHLPCIDQPQAFVTEILSFLEENTLV